MSLMNGFLFLMLGLAGIAVGMILIDLKRAEQQAARDILMIRYHSSKPVMQRVARPERYSQSEDITQENTMTRESERFDRRRASFFTLPDSIGSQTIAQNDHPVRYDFAFANYLNKKEQAIDCLPLEVTMKDVCA